MARSEDFTEEQKEILDQWKSVAQEYEGANHFHFSQHYNPKDAQSKAKTFINDPREENFILLWEQLNSAQRSGSPSLIYQKWQDKGGTDPELANLIEEILDASEYDSEWESRLGAKKTLWELYGLLHIEAKPMLNNSVIAGLEFFGYPRPGSYRSGAETFREFADQYQSLVGYVTGETEHEVPLNLEIDQLFNVIHKVRETDPEKEEIPGAAHLYELVLAARDSTRGPSPGDVQSQQRTIWQVTPGKSGDYWDVWHEEGIASLGFEDVEAAGPSNPASDDSTSSVAKAANTGEGMVHRFQHNVDVGDIVIAKRGTIDKDAPNAIYGIGIITTPYYESEDLPLHHQRFINVEWIENFGKNGLEIAVKDSSDSIKAYTFDDLDNSYYQKLLQRLDSELAHSYTALSNLPNIDRQIPLPDALEDDLSRPEYFWVNQTDTEEIQNEYLTASVDSVWHHDLTQLNKGDVIFHYNDGAVVGHSEVVEEATTFSTEKGERYRVSVDFERFDEPRDHEEIREFLQRSDVRSDQYYPLDRNGRVNQVYLSRLTKDAADYLFQPSQETNYFWISANPSIWKVDEIANGGEVFYTAYNEKWNKRRIFSAFTEATPGDKILFYESTPVKAIVAEGTVVEGLHEGEEEGFDEPVEGISIEYDRSIDEITWEQLNAVTDLENASPLINQAQGSLFSLTATEYETILALEEPEKDEEKELKTLRKKLNPINIDFDMPANLYFEDPGSIRSEIEASLNSGKHIIFTGPPGTGKTKLAKEICRQSVDNLEQVDDHTFTTATSEWTTFDTIGGYVPSTGSEASRDELEFQPRLFLNCFRQDQKGIVNRWLMIDEINRSDIDKAFGQLFSVLSGDSVKLPYERQNQVQYLTKLAG